jgi:glycosyltransferase involved in cell wall biosynthesis
MTDARCSEVTLLAAHEREAGTLRMNSVKERLRLALVNPDAGAYSETFVRAHRERLDADVFFFTGHPHFLCLEGSGKIPVRWRTVRRMLHRISGSKEGGLPRVLSAEQRTLADTFLDRGIHVVLAEFGPTACEVLPACRAAGVPLVAHFHGFDASRRTSIEEYQDRYPALFAYSSAIISVSMAMTRALEALGAPARKILYNPTGPSEEFLDLTPDFASKRLLAVGRFVGKKGPLLTIQAFAKARDVHPDARLIMVGDGVLLSDCEALVQKLDIGDSVDFLGSVTHDRVRELMSSARCFVQHSIVDVDGDSEGTPVAILEAQASGLPVVATRHAGIPDVVVHKETGLLVEEGDVPGMASCMVAMLDDSERCAQFGAAGRRRISDRFSITRHIAALDECLARARVQAIGNVSGHSDA